MRCHSCLSVACLAVLLACALPVLADPAATPAAKQEDAPPTSISSSEWVRGKDEDGDGVRDDVEASLADTQRSEASSADSRTSDELDIQLDEPARPLTIRAEGLLQLSCLDYTVMNPEDRGAVDMALRGQSTFDTRHPCDPQRFPHLEPDKIIESDVGESMQQHQRE